MPTPIPTQTTKQLSTTNAHHSLHSTKSLNSLNTRSIQFNRADPVTDHSDSHCQTQTQDTPRSALGARPREPYQTRAPARLPQSASRLSRHPMLLSLLLLLLLLSIGIVVWCWILYSIVAPLDSPILQSAHYTLHLERVKLILVSRRPTTHPCRDVSLVNVAARNQDSAPSSRTLQYSFTHANWEPRKRFAGGNFQSLQSTTYSMQYALHKMYNCCSKLKFCCMYTDTEPKSNSTQNRILFPHSV
ncbi:hypothetical protein BD289DRAFT_28814 [Coniella lustricola]|uniref:Uncharacterized protein n=1 Tax=Coniella lustricola TaxID=2025994 RepID=A0A2T3AJ20_9PEZI|nr:hypothetical protein BD289DRAFT_28814 [Coniella lustricola]